MNTNNQPENIQYSFVAPSFPGEDAIEGFELKHLLMQSLAQLQSNPAIPAHLQEEAESAHSLLSLILKQIWVKTFEDEEETKPKEIAFELESMERFDFDDDEIKKHQYGTLAELRDLIERQEADDAEIERYDKVAKIIANPIIDTDQKAQYTAGLVYLNFSKESVLTAIQMALLERKGIKGEDHEPATRRLYPNSKTIDLSKAFGLQKTVGDNLLKIIQDANRQKAIDQFTSSSSHERNRRPAFRTSGRNQDTEFVFDKEKLAIRTAEQFADQLMKVRDAKVLQTFFALIKWSNLNDTWAFREVPISEIMGIVLKSHGENKFNSKHRREFSEVLEYLSSITMTISFIGDQVNTKTGKKKIALREERGVRLFRLVATYSVKKEYQSIPKESLIADIHFDKSVITRFSGELFPGNTQLFQQRANIYSDTLLTMDANKDSKAILLGYQLETRFNQLVDKDKCVEYDRAFLIDLCDYAKTDKTKPSKATKQLANNLNKLKQNGIIARYTGLTNTNTDKIRIFPPAPVQLSKA